LILQKYELIANICTFVPKPTKSMKVTLPAIIIVLLMFSACQQGNIYNEHHKFENYTWHRFEKVTFEIPITDAGTKGDIIFTIRHITQYPYPNLPVYIILNTPSGEERILEKDIRLVDGNESFTGDVAGDLWDVEEVLWPGFYFTESGTYTIEIENLIPKMGIPGLVDVGIYVKGKK
jgi:gliding motility-associated lipoprotein GldH